MSEIITHRTPDEGRFKIISVLGTGAGGTVYRAEDRKMSGKEVALKVLSNIFAFEENTLERFKEEINICCNILHKNIVHAYEPVNHEGYLGYTMELIQGSDLGKMFSSGQKPNFSFPEIDKIMTQLLEALSELHRLKIMHRDLKLENIILREDGLVKLSDLGLVKRLEAKGLTKPGKLLGTPQYMPPEYIESAKFDERSDIYACGIVLYELLSGERRLSDKKGIDAINYLVQTNYKIPKLNLPPEQNKYYFILAKALDVNPQNRFQSAEEMKHSFTTYANPKLRPKSLQRKLLSNKALTILLAVALCSLITIAVLMNL